MNTNSGWIKLHRKVQESEMYRSLSSKQRDIFLQILLLANHEEKEWRIGDNLIRIQPGQFITSLPKLKEKCAKDVSIQNIRTCLLILKTWHFLTEESTNQFRTITICKWNDYQGQSTDNLTIDQQTTNRQLTATKNVKKLRSKETIPPIVPQGDESQSLIILFNQIFNRSFRLTDGVKVKIQARRKVYSLKELEEAIVLLGKNRFNHGENDSGWSASPEYLFRNDTNIDKALNSRKVKPPPIISSFAPPEFEAPDNEQRCDHSARIRETLAAKLGM